MRLPKPHRLVQPRGWRSLLLACGLCTALHRGLLVGGQSLSSSVLSSVDLWRAVRDGQEHIVIQKHLDISGMNYVGDYVLTPREDTKSIQGFCVDAPPKVPQRAVPLRELEGIPKCVLTHDAPLLGFQEPTSGIWLAHLYFRYVRRGGYEGTVYSVAVFEGARVYFQQVVVQGDGWEGSGGLVVGGGGKVHMQECSFYDLRLQTAPGAFVRGSVSLLDVMLRDCDAAADSAVIVLSGDGAASSGGDFDASEAAAVRLVSTRFRSSSPMGVASDDNGGNGTVAYVDKGAVDDVKEGTPVEDSKAAPPDLFLTAQDAALGLIKSSAPIVSASVPPPPPPTARSVPIFALALGLTFAVSLAAISIWVYLRRGRRDRHSDTVKLAELFPGAAAGGDATETRPFTPAYIPTGLEGMTTTVGSMGMSANTASAQTSEAKGPAGVKHGSGPSGSSTPNATFVGIYTQFGDDHHPTVHVGGNAYVPGAMGTDMGTAAAPDGAGGAGGGGAELEEDGHSGLVRPRVDKRGLQPAFNALNRALDEMAEKRGQGSQDSGALLFGKYRVLDGKERRAGGQGLVQFVTEGYEAHQYAVKFFLRADAFEHEARIYKHEALRDMLFGGCEVRPNAQARHKSPSGYVLPPSIVMERGESLNEWLRNTNPKIMTVVDAMEDIAGRLAELHKAGFAHRDIKPANLVRLQRRYGWALIDFGCAAQIGMRAPLSFTWRYAAPETIKAFEAGHTDVVCAAAVDIWALGAISLEMLTHKPAFGVNAGQQAVAAMLAGRQPLPWEEGKTRSELVGQLRSLHGIVLQCLERTPSRRPSAEQLKLSLLKLFDSNL